MNKVLLTLVLMSSVISYAGPNKKVRWPAQESAVVSRDIFQCNFSQNSLEIVSLEIFALITRKESSVVLSNISSIVSVTAHGILKVLSSGGELVVSDSTEISGKITLAGNSAVFNFAKGIGTLSIDGTEIKASSCTSVLKKISYSKIVINIGEE